MIQIDAVHIEAGTDVFDFFIDENNLRHFALSETDDQEILKRFLAAERFPAEIKYQLSQFLEIISSELKFPKTNRFHYQ